MSCGGMLLGDICGPGCRRCHQLPNGAHKSATLVKRACVKRHEEALRALVRGGGDVFASGRRVVGGWGFSLAAVNVSADLQRRIGLGGRRPGARALRACGTDDETSERCLGEWEPSICSSPCFVDHLGA